MNRISRRTALAGLGFGAWLGAGCMTKPIRSNNPDGAHCFAVGKSYRPTLTCTPTPVPPMSVEAEAKRFEPAAGMLTIYVVRKRWGDGFNPVRLAVDDGAPVVTPPESFVRVRVRPGAHKLTAEWSEGTTALTIAGAAGDVRFVELVGSAWVWGSTYRLEHGDPADGRRRALALRLVADVR